MDFKSIAEKLKRIDEGVEAQVAECGMMPPMAGMMPPQQDSVSMNVSMNAQGKGGIRDLMDVLKNIENTVDGGNIDSVIGADPHRAEIDADPELDIVMPDHPDDHHDEEEPVMVIDKEEDEAYDNQPSVDYKDNDYMQQTLAGGADEPQKMTKGGYNNVDNAITMASILPVAAMVGRMKEGLQENIQSKLQAHYDRLKEENSAIGTSPQPPLRMNPTRPRPAGIDPVSDNPVKMQQQTVAPQANRPGLDPKGDPKLWDIQFELQKRGYKIKADGLNGPATQKAAADAGLIDATRQDAANPTAASTFSGIGHAIGSGLSWIETAWRNLKTGFSQGRAGMEESADLDDIKKLSGLN